MESDDAPAGAAPPDEHSADREQPQRGAERQVTLESGGDEQGRDRELDAGPCTRRVMRAHAPWRPTSAGRRRESASRERTPAACLRTRGRRIETASRPRTTQPAPARRLARSTRRPAAEWTA